jgi:nucleoside-diphosphate-sugar epimerase
MSKKYIITGASGFIGSALAKRLLQDGHKVWAIGRNKEKLNELKQYSATGSEITTVVADFEDYPKLPELISERGFDSIIHLAWNGTTATITHNNHHEQLKNIAATCEIAEVSPKLECQNIIITSTSYQFAKSVSDPTNPSNPLIYGSAKRAATDLAKAIAYKNKLPYKVLYFPNVFGTNDKSEAAIAFFIKKLIKNEPLDLVSGTLPEDWIYNEELLEGMINTINCAKENAEYYIGHREISTFKEKLIEMKAVLNSNSKLNFGKYPENYFVDYSKFDLDALYNDTEWEAKTPFKDAILKVRDSLIQLNREIS